MSIQAVAWVLEQSEATLADRLVLIAIANHADGKGWNAYPAVPLIAAEAKVDRATVFRALTTLEESGELVVHRRPGRSNMYGITALMGSHDATGKGSQDATGGVANTQKRGRKMRPKPSVTVNEPAQRSPIDTSPIAPVRLPTALSEETRRKGAEFFRTLRQGDKPA